MLKSLLRQPRADILLEKSINQGKKVGESLYENYHRNRIELILYLTGEPHSKPLESAIHIAQKLLDRVIFIAFCEDRGLLPNNSLKKACDEVSPFSRVTNPKWQNFLDLFHSIDKGNPQADIAPYNGGLFRKDPEVDDLEIDDEKTNFFKNIGSYDFRDEINVDVLGHLFERSVHDIERIRFGGLYSQIEDEQKSPKMKKSAERKKYGIYYTPKEFTSFITYNTIKRLADERFKELAEQLGITTEQAETSEPNEKIIEYWHKCFEMLRDIKIVDPACGSGAFLIQAYETLEEIYLDILEHLSHQSEDVDELREEIPNIILNENIYGVDLSPEAVEITQLAIWIRSADKGKTLADLSKNIVCGNSLVSDTSVNPLAMDWKETFPEVFSREKSGFDCVIGNPPWERIKLQEREFFDGRDNDIASAVNAAERRKLIKKLERKNPDLYTLYIKAKEQADKNLEYIRKSNRYPLTGKGDINTYAVFAELAHTIVSKDGVVGILVPSGISTDKTTKDFFGKLVNTKALYGFYDFENRRKVFTNVDGRFKFSVLLFNGPERQSENIDFSFFAHKIEELRDKDRHIVLSAEDIKLINPNTHTCPVFRSNRDAQITKSIYKRVPVLIDKSRKKGGNPWGIKFVTMFHQTNDAELFHTCEQLKNKKFKQQGSIWIKGKKTFLPLYEAKMIQMYDHRAAGVVVNDENWFRQGQTDSTSLVSYQNPEYSVEPRWWADKEVIEKAFHAKLTPALLAFKNVTSPTNKRTMISAFVPRVGVINSAPLITFANNIQLPFQCCFLANLNAFILDYVARQKIGNVNLNFFLIEQFPMFTPDFYENICAWNRKQTLEKWISERVLKLTCTSNDMIPLAEAAGFKPKVYKWKTAERAKLMAELDAAFFILYGIKREDVEYMLSTFSGLKKDKESVLDDTTTTSQILNYYDQFYQ
ncbi:MAG: N-6 DNA methylase [Sedimentisphaerales bacterium]|nr:N-6 DNA methylase [Sedimentisphaerales bacterium]